MDSASSARSMGKGVAVTPEKRKDCDNTTSAPMNKHNIVMGNQSTMAQDDYPDYPPGFMLSDTRKYKLEKLEREYHDINVCDPKGVVPDTCPYCAKEGGPCKENEGDMPFFRMKFANENRLYYLDIMGAKLCIHRFSMLLPLRKLYIVQLMYLNLLQLIKLLLITYIASSIGFLLPMSNMCLIDKFQVPPCGEVDLIMRHPPVIVHGKYRIVDGLTHVDGRLSVNHGWKDFVNQTGLKPHMEVKIEASLVHGNLTLHIGPI